MKISNKLKNLFTKFSITLIIVVICTIYYASELRPFSYSGYEKHINRLQRFDAELNQAVVQSRFSILKNYNPIDKAIEDVQSVLSLFTEELEQHPDNTIYQRLLFLESKVKEKQVLTNDFMRLNPIIINAINQFSTILAQIIELHASTQLVENALVTGLQQQLDQDLNYQIMEKINNLFRGILIYINLRKEEDRAMLVKLVADLKSAPTDPEKYPKLHFALAYAEKILEIQPQLTRITTAFFDVPIVESLSALNDAYKKSFQGYQTRAFAYRITLYVLVIILLVLLRWAFSQLRNTVNKLNVEVQRKIKAEKELEQINRQLEQRVAQRTRELTVKNHDLNQALADLKEAQDQLIIQEKMASVGMLTTGIAHEIKNPLNFVNNFSEISIELIEELSEAFIQDKANLKNETLENVDDLLKDLKMNCVKIKEHGERADTIVKTMLMHSQEIGVQKEMVHIENLMTENLQIALEAFQTTHGKLEVHLEKQYGADLKPLLVAPQAIGRVFIYLIDNALYALLDKKKHSGTDFTPTLHIQIDEQEKGMSIKIKDNGTGIPSKHIDKIFEPFFTTKPTGKGNTGLGLSICYDTVVKQHKGELKASSEEGSYTEMTVLLPMIENNSAN